MKTLSYYIKNKFGYEAFEYFEIKVEVPDDQPIAEIYQQLKQEADKLRTSNVDELQTEINNKRYKLLKLNQQIEEATKKWNSIQEFLAGQGIKDPTFMPSFTNLLPQSVEREIVEDEDDDQEDE